jgi:hypothetical protein
VAVSRKEPEAAIGKLLIDGLRRSGPNRAGEKLYLLLLIPDTDYEVENMRRLDVLIQNWT